MSSFGHRIVTLKVAQRAGRMERAGVSLLPLGLRRNGQESGDPAAPFAVVAAHPPEPVELSCEPQSFHGARRRGFAPRQCGTDVVVLTVEPRQLRLKLRVRLRWVDQPRRPDPESTRRGDRVPPVPHYSRVADPGHSDARSRAGGIVSRRCGCPPRRGSCRPARSARPVPLAVDAVAAAHALSGVERPAAGKHRYPPQHTLLGVAQQLVAPVDQRAQRTLARERGTDPPVSTPKRSSSRAAQSCIDIAPRRAAPPARWPARFRPGGDKSRSRPRHLSSSPRSPVDCSRARSTNSRTASQATPHRQSRPARPPARIVTAPERHSPSMPSAPGWSPAWPAPRTRRGAGRRVGRTLPASARQLSSTNSNRRALGNRLYRSAPGSLTPTRSPRPGR